MNKQLTESVPMHGLENGMPIVTVEVNGRQLNMLLDSGALSNMIDEKCFEELNAIEPLDKTQEKNELFGAGGVFETSFTTQVNIKLGNRQFDTPFIVFKANVFDRVRENFGVELHGILGHEFLVNNQPILDFSKSMVLFHNPSEQENNTNDELIELGPIYGLRNGIAVAIVNYEDLQLQLLIDTCASHNMLDERVFNQICEIVKTGKTQVEKTMIGIEGSESNVNSQTKMKIKMGRCTFDVTFKLLQINSLEPIVRGTGIKLHGVMGLEFFYCFDLILDYSKEMIYVHKPSQETSTKVLR